MPHRRIRLPASLSVVTSATLMKPDTTTLPPGKTPICVACFKTLTAEEQHYYEYRCETCEGKWHARLRKWLEGEADWDIDANAGSL